MSSETDSEQLGVAAALERTSALETLLSKAILDTHEVSGDPNLDADKAEIERESLLAVNEQLGLLALKLRQYGQLGPREHTKKTTVLSELDELRRDLITVSYTSQPAIVAAKDVLRDVRKFAEMHSDSESLDDSEDSLSDVECSIDGIDDKAKVAGKDGQETLNGTTTAQPDTLKKTSSTGSEQRRELEEALSRAETALARNKSRTVRRRSSDVAHQEPRRRRADKSASPSGSSRKLHTVHELAGSPHKGRSSGSRSKSALARSCESTPRQLSPAAQRRLYSPSKIPAERYTSPRLSKLGGGGSHRRSQSRHMSSVSSLNDISDSDSSCSSVADFSSSPALHLPQQQKQSTESTAFSDSAPSSPFKGFGTRPQEGAAGPTPGEGSEPDTTERLAAWRPEAGKDTAPDRGARQAVEGGGGHSSSSSSCISHEGDSASSVTSSVSNLRGSRPATQSATFSGPHSRTISTVQETENMETPFLPTAADMSESPRDSIGSAGDVANKTGDRTKPTTSISSQNLDTGNDPTAHCTAGVPAAGSEFGRSSVAANSFSSDRTAASCGVSNRLRCEAPPPPRRHAMQRWDTKPNHQNNISSTNIVRGTISVGGNKRRARPVKHHKRRMFLGLAAGLVTGAAALVSPALETPAREELKREVCERFGRLQTPQQLVSGIKDRYNNQKPSRTATLSTAATSKLFDQFPDGNLGRG